MILHYFVVGILTLGLTFLIHREDTAIPKFIKNRLLPAQLKTCEYCFAFWTSLVLFIFSFSLMGSELAFVAVLTSFILFSILNALLTARVGLVLLDILRDFADIVSYKKAKAYDDLTNNE